MGKKQVSVLSTSTKHGTNEVERRSSLNINHIQCPFAFISYSKYMGEVNLADQKRKYYSIARKSMKWWF